MSHICIKNSYILNLPFRVHFGIYNEGKKERKKSIVWVNINSNIALRCILRSKENGADDMEKEEVKAH